MLSLKSKYSPEQLTARWDERTSPARFAGNDAEMDNIYIASRRKNRVFLIRKASGALDPFATVFRGRILSCGEGSELRGNFTKRLFDYVLILLLAAFDVYLYYRANALEVLTPAYTAGLAVFAVIVLMFAIPMPFARKRYREFLTDITEPDEEK